MKNEEKIFEENKEEIIKIDNKIISRRETKEYLKLAHWITIFLFDIIIHLSSCIYPNKKIRATSKIFLMPLLFKVYLSLTEKESQSKTIILGLLFGAIGDAFLLTDDNFILIILGLVSFLIGHIFYIISFTRRIGTKDFKKNIFLFLIFLSFFLINCYYQCQHYIINWLKGSGYEVAGLIYIVMLGLINTFSWTLFFVKKNYYSFLICMGTALFWYSDFLIAKKMFYDKNIYLGDFIIMSTYISAQACISIGMSYRMKKRSII